MKAFNKVILVVTLIILVIFGVTNLFLFKGNSDGSRPYLVEVNRMALEIEKNGLDRTGLSKCSYITGVEKCENDFYNSDSDYTIRKIKGVLYRFDYKTGQKNDRNAVAFKVNVILAIMTVLIFSVLLFIRRKILAPFEKLTDVPYELSKGNLAAPVKETKSKFFGRFIWGVDLLRENMEEQRQRELELQKNKKMLLLSLSHDIKTPLSAIKLYSKALSKGLYDGRENQKMIAEKINEKADEIEDYISQIITASREEFLSLDVNMSEFYLSELINKVSHYYNEKLSLLQTEFSVEKYMDCILKGDIDRSVEVLQNILENAIKYGDGRSIEIRFAQEDGCMLITVSNSGCSLRDTDLPHMFDSFWRGENAGREKGSGLGLYICRQLMHKMNGEIFAEISGNTMNVTVVFGKA